MALSSLKSSFPFGDFLEKFKNMEWQKENMATPSILKSFDLIHYSIGTDFKKAFPFSRKKNFFHECKATFQKVFNCSQQSLKFLTSTHQSKAMLFIVQKLNFFVKFNFQHSKHEIVTKFHI